MIEQPDAMGFLGLDHASGEEKLFRHRPTDLLGKAPGRIHATVLDGQEPEPSALAADADVEARREHRTASEGQAVERADCWLAGRGYVP